MVLWLLTEQDIYDIHLSQEILKKDFACQEESSTGVFEKNRWLCFFP